MSDEPIDADWEPLMDIAQGGPCREPDFIANVDDIYFEFMPVEVGGRIEHVPEVATFLSEQDGDNG